MVSFSGFIFSSFIGFKSLVSLILLAVIPVAVQTNEGERVEGKLLSIQDSTLVMDRKSVLLRLNNWRVLNQPALRKNLAPLGWCN